MEESLRIRRLDVTPSPEEFATQIEAKNVPTVFRGCVKEWEAFSKWNPSNGGLTYLEELVGPAVVEAMLSRSAPVFYGDLRRHERVLLPFRDFIGSCKQQLQEKKGRQADCVDTEREGMQEIVMSSLLHEDPRDQIYLAQVPLMNVDKEEKIQLDMLQGDVRTPVFLKKKELASINLWMNKAQSRSSTHYDPHHNLLCIVTGCKQVCLWPPSASPLLYPMPVYGEASNHSYVALEDPDYIIHPRAQRLMEYSDKVVLHAGDALFIPEGWYHQVDSDDLTIAVNFWWSSVVMSSMTEHMDAYYLRRIIRRLTEKEMEEVLTPTVSNSIKKKRVTNMSRTDENSDDESTENKPRERDLSHDLDAVALDALHKLVSLVHDSVSLASQNPAEPAVSSTELPSNSAAPSICLNDDMIAKIFWTLDPERLRSVFLSMASKFPRTLEALIIHLLTPVGAEVLTRKFDEMDLETSEEERNAFYQAFYGAFDDVNAAMDAILTRKETFARKAFKNVFDRYLGLKLDSTMSMVG